MQRDLYTLNNEENIWAFGTSEINKSLGDTLLLTMHIL